MYVDEYNILAPYGQIRVEDDRVHQMINDAFGVQAGMERKQYLMRLLMKKQNVILREKLMIFILITLEIKCHVGETCSITMMKMILIICFHRYQFLIKIVKDLKTMESEGSLVWKWNQL
ncbi:hypothetical protein H5410_050567 [Solanum commersonii]|uniref:Uncharacterized protein n=1 Tax=Solanum commersonii TaxID=4109 RepID=A0A9J5WXZ4_SOLCO|nr:hypothetical protein H5410_050567 [Solanum commersonii]